MTCASSAPTNLLRHDCISPPTKLKGHGVQQHWKQTGLPYRHMRHHQHSGNQSRAVFAFHSSTLDFFHAKVPRKLTFCFGRDMFECYLILPTANAKEIFSLAG